MARVVGIDLGTATSVVAALDFRDPRHPKPFAVPNTEGSRTTPSVVAFTANGHTLIGEPANRQALLNLDGTVSSVKQYMGTDQTFACGGHAYGAGRISALILGKLKRDAEEYLGEEVTGAVITVPAYFSHAARLATKEAGELAGLRVLRIINEPTAAALYDGIDRDDQTVLVVHCGGGTFDVSLVEVGDGVNEVKATCGDARLGGDDWDIETARHLAARFRSLHGVDLTADPTAWRRLREAAERAKIELSSATEATIEVACVAASARGHLHLHDRMSRHAFQQVTQPQLDRCAAPLKQVLTDAGIPVSEVSRVVMTGGSTRMPAMISLVRDHFGDHTPTMVMQPRESVAYGAALQAGVLTGEVRDVLLLDVTARSLGIAIGGGVMSKLIERGTTIPTKRSETFVPAPDADTTATLHIPVLEGEEKMAADNEQLGVLPLIGLTRPANAGTAHIEVTLEIDANALLRASATDSATGTTWSMNVDGACVVQRTQAPREPLRPPAPRRRRSKQSAPKQDPPTEQQPAHEPQTSSAPTSFALTLLGVLIALGLLGGVFWAFL
ncbi:Hsp70 family protein [Streptomyces sp. NPDC001388]|uniref:Hsp70 family protein n=1 Tax=unclassified Streptomyces TaxID=2593676 RepID=UPI0036A2EC91